MTKTISILNSEFLKVMDKETGTIFCGSDQEWYSSKKQQLTGCGPSTAANLILYDRQKAGKCGKTCTKDCLKAIMEEVWGFVTPKKDGITSTNIFLEGIQKYAEKHHRVMKSYSLDITEKEDERPSIGKVIRFIESGLVQDQPVAFLNLCNGNEPELESWHWVTITMLKYDIINEQANVVICDEGEEKNVNLALWLINTKKGGGFAYLLMD